MVRVALRVRAPPLPPTAVRRYSIVGYILVSKTWFSQIASIAYTLAEAIFFDTT